MAKLKYIGRGAFRHGIPARDLSESEVKEYGGVAEMRAYGEGSIFGMGYGFAVGAILFKKGYAGPLTFDIANPSSSHSHK